MIKKLHAVECEILKQMIYICEKHHIRYFFLGGSALGVVRHSGFIPWDDDIDIGMPRPDYERFLSIAQAELEPNLFLQTYETDPYYPYLYAKIRNSTTTFLESIDTHLSMNQGVFIDIFPLDGYASVKLLGKIHWLAFRLYKAAVQHKLLIKHKKNVIHGFIDIYAAIFSLSRLRRSLDKLMKKYDYEKSDFVINWCGSWGLKEMVPKHFFGEGCRMEFEGISVTIPNDYDGYLKSLYGDYMTLPPIKERRNRHLTNVIDLENPYTKYTVRKQ